MTTTTTTTAIHSHAVPAIVVRDESARTVPFSDRPDVRDLQVKAEKTVAWMTDHQVEMFEITRAGFRAGNRYDPVPLTDRGARLLARSGYRVSSGGYLIVERETMAGLPYSVDDEGFLVLG